ncbi:MAG: L,D-transpeptidase family protein [Pseudomonadota bacterium]
MKNIKRRFIFCFSVGLFSLAFHLANAATPGDNPSYQRLEKILPFYQAAIEHPWPYLNISESLSVGMQEPAVLVLRQRLCATHDLSASACELRLNEMRFDKELEEAVALFQERHGLLADGVVGKKTCTALNASPEHRVHQLQLNLQRWSRLIGLAEPAYIWINVPDHYLRLIKNHHIIFISRVIVGKPSRQTPEINSKVTRIILNPYWTVPPGIARNDVIPQIIKNKNYLSQHRMRVFAVGKLNKELDPNEVDWLAVKQNPSRVILRQDPGPHNALGQIKFEFSNPYLVYLHDTPAKGLFNAEKRLFSSGCVRMEDPFDLLEALAEFDPSIKQAEAQIETTLESGKTVTLRLKQPVPIHLTYITAWADKAGVVHFWDDVYGRDPVLASNKKKLESDLPAPI